MSIPITSIATQRVGNILGESQHEPAELAEQFSNKATRICIIKE